jgi:hypothetical protein
VLILLHGINVPSPDEHNYHESRQVQRVERAKQLIDPGDVLAVIDRRIADEPDPTQHPLYGLVLFCLDRQVAVHGGEFWDRWRQMVLAAIDTCLDDLLEMED